MKENEIIAEFMGIKKRELIGYDYEGNKLNINGYDYEGYNYVDKREYVEYGFKSRETKYHKIVHIDNLLYPYSWDWLMPVVDRINGMGKEYNLDIFKTYVSLSVEKGGRVFKDFSFAYSEYITGEQSGLEAAYKLVVRFIKWHNEQELINLNK